MKAFMLKTIASLCLLGVDHNVEVTSSMGLNKTIDHSDVTVDYQFIKEGKYSYFFANPRLSIVKSGEFTSSLGLGIRKDLGNSLVGLHLFGDYSYLSGSHHFQMGPSLEYIHPKWDFTLNYYMPISTSKKVDNDVISSIHYLDGNIFYKTNYLDVGLEPSFNWKNKKLGVVGHVVIPSAIGNVKLSVGRNSRFGNHAKLGITFPIFGNYLDNRATRIRRSAGVVKDIRNYTFVNPEVNPIQPVIPVEEPKLPLPAPEVTVEEEQSWWDYLFGWMVVDEVKPDDNPMMDWANYDFFSYDDSSSYAYEPPAEVVGALSFEVDNGHLSDGSSSSMSDVGTPPEFSPATEYASMSDSAFLESIGETLASEGGYSITVDSGDTAMGSLDASFDSSPSVSSNIAGNDSPDSTDSYDIIGQNSPYSTGH